MVRNEDKHVSSHCFIESQSTGNKIKILIYMGVTNRNDFPYQKRRLEDSTHRLSQFQWPVSEARHNEAKIEQEPHVVAVRGRRSHTAHQKKDRAARVPGVEADTQGRHGEGRVHCRDNCKRVYLADRRECTRHDFTQANS